MQPEPRPIRAATVDEAARALPARERILARVDSSFEPERSPRRPARRRRRSTGRSPPGCARATLDDYVGQEHLLGAGLGAAHRDRVRPPALDGPVRPAGHRQDDARPDDRRARRRRVRGALRGQRRAARGARGDRPGARAQARRARRRSSSSTRSTASTRPSRTRCCRRSRRGSSRSSGATTENPYFEVNSALLSRAQVYELHALEAADVEGLLRRAMERRRDAATTRSRTRRSRSSPRARAATRGRR